MKQLEEDTAGALEDVTTAKSAMGRVLFAWDSYSVCLSSLQAWMEQGSATRGPEVRCCAGRFVAGAPGAEGQPDYSEAP